MFTPVRGLLRHMPGGGGVRADMAGILQAETVGRSEHEHDIKPLTARYVAVTVAYELRSRRGPTNYLSGIRVRTRALPRIRADQKPSSAACSLATGAPVARLLPRGLA